MRPTAMQRSMDKAGGKSPVPPTLPKHSTTVTVVCNGVRSSTSSPLTSPVKSRRSGDFTQMLDDRVEVRTDSSTHRTSVTVNETKRKAPPPPLSPRDKNGTTNVNFSSLPSPKSQSVVTVPPVKPKPTPAPLLTTQQTSATPSAKSEPAPPPPSAKSPRSACSVPNTPLIRSSAPPPLLPRSNSMASSGGVVTLAIKSNDHHSNGGAYSNDSGTYNSAGNAYPDNTSASSKSGALNSGKTKSDAFNTAETDFFASLPSLPPDDYISPPTKHVSSSTSYKTAPVAEKSVSDSSYFSLSSSASSSPANARTERSAQSHSSYSSIPSSPASSDKSAVSSNASSPALSLKYSSVPCFPTSPTLGEASVSFSVSSAHRPTSGATRTGQKAAVSGASSADPSSPVPSGSLAVFNSSGPAAPSADPRSATSTVERKAASTTIIVNKGPALPAAAPAAPNKSAKTSDSDRSSPSSSSSSSSYPEPHPHTNLQSHHHHNQHPAPPTPPTPPPPAVARKPAAAVVSRPPSMTGIAENGSFMEEKEEAEYGGQSGMAGGEEDQHKEVFYVNMQAGCTNGVAAGTCGTETEATFAGRRDVKDVQTLSERQIVSSKGTVRGFKNRVRAGIVTFIEQPFSKVRLKPFIFCGKFNV
ncbi:sialidase-like [Littorina saxatilis]|uniref:sialidase-like n=1 Tax=Littorina saxatilis TaxID=31220 RepID=UPI0038B43BAC